MTEFLMTTWDGAGTTPPLMSVARALVQRGHDVRVLADTVLRPDVEAAGAEHVSWTRAPQRTAHGRDGDFIRDWEAKEPGGDFARMRDRLAVGPAKLHAADVREEIERRRPAALLSELLLFGRRAGPQRRARPRAHQPRLRLRRPAASGRQVRRAAPG